MPRIIKSSNELSPSTIRQYKVALKRLFKSLPTLAGAELAAAKKQVQRFETQLGVKAKDLPGPGRPRTKS